MTFFCRSCLKHKDDSLAADPTKPQNRRTCAPCNTQIKLLGKRANRPRKIESAYLDPAQVNRMLRLVGL